MDLLTFTGIIALLTVVVGILVKVIGFPDQTEESILQTIEFNKLLNPDNITVAYYSPYVGTGQQKKA